jgi:hypothetical protein
MNSEPIRRAGIDPDRQAAVAGGVIRSWREDLPSINYSGKSASDRMEVHDHPSAIFEMIRSATSPTDSNGHTSEANKGRAV